MTTQEGNFSRPSFGVLVGRFQVHELHDGHMELFRIIRGRHSRIIVFLGCTKTGLTRRNPLDFEVRKRMIQAEFPDFTVLPLQDRRSDTVWSRSLDDAIWNTIGGAPAEVTLYGSRDSFVPHYKGTHKIVELAINVPAQLSATDIRAKLTNTVMSSPDFRAGIIYAIGQLYPRCVTTVDVAILHGHRNKRLLLGRKSDEHAWRFVGGHAEPPKWPYEATSFEADIKREAFEETGLDIDGVDYIGSTGVDDWRWKDEPDGVKTLFFVATARDMGAQAGDDLNEILWISIDQLQPEMLVPEHRVLLRMLKSWLEIMEKPYEPAKSAPSRNNGTNGGTGEMAQERMA